MLYAIGDIHGCLKPLKQLIHKLSLKTQDELVFVGDYVDRGLESKGVIDFLLANRTPHWRFLRGNHEQMFWDWIHSDDPAIASTWLSNGGRETLASYFPNRPLDEILEQEDFHTIRSFIPSEHIQFLKFLLLSYETPDYFFCHAGINLDRSLNDQKEEDLLWIRNKFLKDPRPTPKLVIHGHTPVKQVDLNRDRIDIDTGCVYGNRLTAISFPDLTLYQVKC